MATSSPMSSAAEMPETFLAKIKQAIADKQKIDDGIQAAQKSKAAKKVAAMSDIEKKLPSLHSWLSKLPADLSNRDNILRPGSGISAQNKLIIEKNIHQQVNKSLKKVVVSLSKTELGTLKREHDPNSIPAEYFDRHVFRSADPAGRTTDAYRELPALADCMPAPASPCGALIGLPTTPPEVAAAPATVTAPAPEIETKEDILKNTNDLFSKLSPPEYAPVLAINKRASEADVKNSINALEFNGGPADEPAFYDFFSLQIAFEHVWQELFDGTIQELLQQAYETIVGLGMDPPAPVAGAGVYEVMTQLKLYARALDPAKEPIPVNVTRFFNISTAEWHALDATAQAHLELNIAGNILKEKNPSSPTATGLLLQGQQMIANAGQKIKAQEAGKYSVIGGMYLPPLETILGQLDAKLKEKYAFTVFAANDRERSVNFGIILNYRQQWTPLTYQAGELIKTIPLAPKEVRKYSKKITTKQSRSQKDNTSSSAKLSSDSNDTVRSEAEVMDKAMKKVTSNIAAKSGYSSSWSPWSFSLEASYGKEASTDSSQAKKDFREAVVKSAQELKNDRSVEISSIESSDYEGEESGEISNPNDEIAVTYLFYELQRRYRINEFLNRVTPVVLVAQEVPAPGEIDEDWLICYQWILSKVILDPSFLPALNYLVSKVVGDKYALEEQRINLEQQRAMVANLQEEFLAIKQQYNNDYKKMEESVERKIKAIEENHYGHFRRFKDIIIDQSADFLDVAKAREESYREEYEKTMKDEREMRARLEREVTALQSATDNYTKMLADHMNIETSIKRLQVHVKENILYYMQAIWTFEPADQRYFRLYQTKVPVLSGTRSYSLTDETMPGMYPNWDQPASVMDVHCTLDTPIVYKTLVELADVDKLLGFKGNYMIFPLKESNVLTDFLMSPYINKYSGVSDPDPAANWSLEDFNQYLCCLRKKIASGELSQETFDQYEPALTDLYQKLITDPLRENEEIVVPTKSLFIEALPGVHPVLEDFKLMHRALDVKKVQAEVRYAELENLRSAARLVAEEFGDPHIEKQIIIEGNTSGFVTPVDGN